MRTPSSRISRSSSALADICPSPRRYMMLTAASRPSSRREVQAQSTAVKPPPMTTTSLSIGSGMPSLKHFMKRRPS